MKRTVEIFVISALCAAVLGAAMAQKVIEAIVAVVNDEIITVSEYREQYEMTFQAQRAQAQAQGQSLSSQQIEQLKKGILDLIITQMLLLQEAKKKDLNVSDQVTEYINNLKKQYELETDAQLIQELQKQGMTYDEFKKQVEQQMLQQALVFTEVRRNIAVDDSHFVDYYKKHPEEFVEPAEYHIRAVTLSGEGRTPDEIAAKKKEVDDRLAAGEDFGEIAGQLSEGPEKENKGDLGTFKSGTLAGELEDAVKTLEEGALSPWVEMRGGWFRLLLEGKVDSRMKSFEESRAQIEQRIYQQEEQEKLQEYMKSLRKRSYIKILIENPEDLLR